MLVGFTVFYRVSIGPLSIAVFTRISFDFSFFLHKFTWFALILVGVIIFYWVPIDFTDLAGVTAFYRVFKSVIAFDCI